LLHSLIRQIHFEPTPNVLGYRKSPSPFWSCLFSYLFDYFDYFFVNWLVHFHLGPPHLWTRSPRLKMLFNSSFTSSLHLTGLPQQTDCQLQYLVHQRLYFYFFLCLSFSLCYHHPHFTHRMCQLSLIYRHQWSFVIRQVALWLVEADCRGYSNQVSAVVLTATLFV
jgi:hypothetical protein